AGLSSGDLPYVSYSAWLHMDHRLGAGDDLAAVDEEADRYLALMQRTKNPVTSAVLTISKQMCANLRGRTRSRTTLSDEKFDEEALNDILAQPTFVPVAPWFSPVRMEPLAPHGDYETALGRALLAKEKSANVKGFPAETDRRFFASLFYYALSPPKPPA